VHAVVHPVEVVERRGELGRERVAQAQRTGLNSRTLALAHPARPLSSASAPSSWQVIDENPNPNPALGRETKRADQVAAGGVALPFEVLQVEAFFGARDQCQGAPRARRSRPAATEARLGKATCRRDGDALQPGVGAGRDRERGRLDRARRQGGAGDQERDDGRARPIRRRKSSPPRHRRDSARAEQLTLP